MNKEISIVIADDHPLLLDGLYNQLTEKGFNVLAKEKNGALALDAILQHQPDIAILDLEMPLLSGFEVIKKCKKNNLSTKFIALTYHKEQSFILQASKLDIDGYLLKDEPFPEIEKAIKEIKKGGTFFSKTFTSIFDKDVTPEIKKISFLTPSERTILRLIAQEKSSKEIAEELFISLRTVQKHRTNIIAKLDLPTSKDPLSDWVLKFKEIILSL